MQAMLERLRRRREEMDDEGGFTLIELLIVIVILGILAAIVVFAVQNLTSSSSQASCGSDYKTVETAAEAYKAQMGNYPSGTGGVGTATDTDDGTVATLTNGASVGTAVNAAGATSGAGSELLVQSGTTPNLVAPTSASAVGPWLKDLPQNASHYVIFVSNDGKDTIAVLDAKGIVQGTTAAACSTVS
jgi:prepilin-type N-terminal cleavage/methylation domain-containing protein